MRNPLQVVASDIGVIRYASEEDEQYKRRITYSAARFIVSASCLDDGTNGAAGISKQALHRRVARWVTDLDAFAPGIFTWFADNNGIQALYGRLINIGEIQSADFGEHYRSVRSHRLHIAPGLDAIIGFYDASDKSATICSSPLSQLIVSGLTTISASDDLTKPESINRSFLHLANRRWITKSSIGNVEFHNPHRYCWGIRNEAGWETSPNWTEGLALARAVRGNDVIDYYIARQNRTGTDCTPLAASDARLLSVLLQKERGTPMHIAYEPLDRYHVCLPLLPFGYLPGEHERIIEALTWPVDSVSGTNRRIARIEALPAVKSLLEASNFFLEERNGSNTKR